MLTQDEIDDSFETHFRQKAEELSDSTLAEIMGNMRVLRQYAPPSLAASRARDIVGAIIQARQDAIVDAAQAALTPLGPQPKSSAAKKAEAEGEDAPDADADGGEDAAAALQDAPSPLSLSDIPPAVMPGLGLLGDQPDAEALQDAAREQAMAQDFAPQDYAGDVDAASEQGAGDDVAFGEDEGAPPAAVGDAGAADFPPEVFPTLELQDRPRHTKLWLALGAVALIGLLVLAGLFLGGQPSQ